MGVHEVAAAGFADAADYEAARPGYPPEAIAFFAEHLGIAPGRRLLDLAAGTGKFTRLLRATGADIVAAEPVAGMRAILRDHVPGIPIVSATAEHLPFADGSIDVLTVAQAWHWFDDARASAEVHRVVRRDGGVGLTWNARDRSVSWVDAIWSIMDRVEKRAPWRQHDNWRDSARPIPGFAPMITAEFHHEHVVTPEQVVQRVASVSHVVVLPEAERAAVLDEVRAVLDEDPATHGQPTVAIPYRVDCIAFKRVRR